MLSLIIALSLLTFNCNDANPEISQYQAELSVYNGSCGVVLRSTQKLYCSEANEWIYFYSNGKVVICTDTARIEGTYSLEDGREGISLNFNGHNAYCRASLDRAGNLISITYNGYVYRKR